MSFDFQWRLSNSNNNVNKNTEELAGVLKRFTLTWSSLKTLRTNGLDINILLISKHTMGPLSQFFNDRQIRNHVVFCFSLVSWKVSLHVHKKRKIKSTPLTDIRFSIIWHFIHWGSKSLHIGPFASSSCSEQMLSARHAGRMSPFSILHSNQEFPYIRLLTETSDSDQGLLDFWSFHLFIS